MEEYTSSDILPHSRISSSKAAASFPHQLGSEGNSGLEVEEVMRKPSVSTRKERAEVKVQYGKKTKLRPRASPMKGSPTKLHYGSSSSDAVLSTSLVVSTSSHWPAPRPTDKEGLGLHLATGPSLIAEGDVSDLTSLSSSTCSLSPGMTSPIDNNVPKLPLYTTPKAVTLTARLELKYEQPAELNEPKWSANDLDSYVWVLLEPNSKRIYDPDQDENDCKERLWWPAKVCYTEFQKV